MPSSRWLRRAIAGLAAVLLVTSCSGSDDGDDGGEETMSPGPGGDPDAAKPLAERTPVEIAQAGIDALHKAGSAHFLMEMSGAMTLTLDMRAADDGTCAGEMTVPNGVIEVVQHDDEVWARPDARLWQEEGAGAEFEGMFIHGPSVHPHFAGLQNLCSWEHASTIEQVDSDAAAVGADVTWSKGEETTVRRRSALTVHREASANGLESEDTMVIAAEGDPHLMRLVSLLNGPNGETRTQIDISQFGATIDAPAPPADQTVEADELGEINPFNNLGL